MTSPTPNPLHRFKAEFFKALGHPLRLALLDALRNGERSVTQLQAITAADQSSISQQLTVLRHKGFVEFRKVGTTTYYRVVDHEVYIFLDLGRSIFERQLQNSSYLLAHLREGQAVITPKGVEISHEV
jgi:DNA-binding transcriptional ArsR family regulator